MRPTPVLLYVALVLLVCIAPVQPFLTGTTRLGLTTHPPLRQTHTHLHIASLRGQTHIHPPINNLLGPNLSKYIKGQIMRSAPVLYLASITPTLIKSFLGAIYPGDLVVLVLFHLSYLRFLKFAHKSQRVVWEWAKREEGPYNWDVRHMTYDKSPTHS
jgi:hypothetical protein